MYPGEAKKLREKSKEPEGGSNRDNYMNCCMLWSLTWRWEWADPAARWRGEYSAPATRTAAQCALCNHGTGFTKNIIFQELSCHWSKLYCNLFFFALVTVYKLIENVNVCIFFLFPYLYSVFPQTFKLLVTVYLRVGVGEGRGGAYCFDRTAVLLPREG